MAMKLTMDTIDAEEKLKEIKASKRKLAENMRAESNALNEEEKYKKILKKS